MFLIDTNVISEIRKDERANPSVRAWFDSHAAESYHLSVLTLGEIRKGIEQIRAKAPVKAAALETWHSEIAVSYEGRILEIGIDEADIWGRLGSQVNLPEVDGLIAATAIARGLTVATRNIKDFERCGVDVINPWEFPGSQGVNHDTDGV